MAFDKFRKCPFDDALMENLYNLALDFERKRQFNKAEAVFRYMADFKPKFRDLEQRLIRAKAMSETVMLGGSSTRTNISILEGGQVEKPMLGRYQIEKELGKGAMGVVYFGRDPKINRVVAIKTMALSQEFEEDEQEALEPTTSAAPGGDPVVIYMGTPPADISERGEPFVRVRNAAITGADKRSAWVEHSASGDVDKMDDAALRVFTADRQNWAAGNPALGGRIKVRTVEGEQFRYSPRSFARERLNMWPTPSAAGKSAIDSATWADLAIENPPEDWPLAAIGLDMNHERTRVTIGVAAFAPEGIHLELAEDAPFTENGTDALVEWVVKRAGRRIPVVLDAFSPIRSIEPELRKRKVLVRVLSASELSQACGGLHDSVMRDGSVTHFAQEALDKSLDGAVKQKFGDGGAWKWNRKNLEVDLTPTMAATCAHFGAVKFGKRREPGEQKKAKVSIC